MAFRPLGIAGSATIFQTLFGQGLIQCTTPTAGNNACVTPAVAGPFGPVGIDVTNSGPLSPLQVLFVNQPGYRPPIAQQASFGIEREIGPGFSISLSGIYTHTQRIPVALDTNLLPAPFSTVTLANGQKVSYRNWNTTDPITHSGSARRHRRACPANTQSMLCESADCPEQPIQLRGLRSLRGRHPGSQESASASTSPCSGITPIAKGFDTSTDYNTDYGPQDPTNLNLDRALSEFDQRHKLVIAGVFDSPWRQSILSGFQLAPIFEAHSGHPFNLLAGGEVNGDNHTTNERPIGAPRDTGLGPDYIDFDMRLSWQHKLGEKSNLQFTAEGFNLANRTNFASVNNEVSPLFGFTAGVHDVQRARDSTGHNSRGWRTCSTPWPSPRPSPSAKIQLGVRFSF
jgi:hypothetical protein